MGRIIMDSFIAGICFVAMLISFTSGKYFLGVTNTILFIANLGLAINNSREM